MKIEQSVQGENGTMTFKGTLNSDELDLVLTAGLSTLYAHGVLAITVPNIELVDQHGAPEGLQ